VTRTIAFRGCDAPSHALRRTRATLLGIGLALLSACTLIQRPEPVTTLQISMTDTDLVWPAELMPGKVESVSALRSNRVLVVDGAVLMQHEGLRWVETPAVMWSEQLRALHARSTAQRATKASIEVWLGEFNLRVGAERTQEVVVSADATLVCNGSDRTIPVAPVSASGTSASSDPQALARAFGQASEEVLATLLEQSSERAADCAAP